MNKELRINKSGFIALISAIVIAFMLVIVTVALGMTSFFGRVNIFDAESKERSLGLAEACVDKAISSLALDFTPLNNVEINVGPSSDDKCTIVSTELNQPTGGQTRIKTKSVINKAYTNLTVVIDIDYETVSWDEVVNF